MEKLTKWETAFLYDGINEQILGVKEQIEGKKEPSPLTNEICNILISLIDKIKKNFEFEENAHFEILVERIDRLPRYKNNKNKP